MYLYIHIIFWDQEGTDNWSAVNYLVMQEASQSISSHGIYQVHLEYYN